MSVPYIGAKISVTSRSLIRYEGVLAAVDPKEATISLEQVRMMGTEGRLPGQDILPSDEIYDAVVFKSADIEDLQVFEAPAPPSRPFMDPAIVSSTRGSAGTVISPPTSAKPLESSTGNQSSSSFGWPATTTPAATGATTALGGVNGGTGRLQFGTAVTAPVGSNRPGTTASGMANAPSGSPVPSFGSFAGPTSSRPWEAAPRLNVNVENVRPTFGSMAVSRTQPATSFASAASGSASLVDVESIDKDRMKPTLITPSSINKSSTGIAISMNSVGTIASDGRDEGDKVIAYNTITGRMEVVERQTRTTFASVVSAGAGRFKVTGDGAARPAPRGDYDFAQANALLEKDRSLSLVGDNPGKGTFYDRNSSFFDNISCEATCGKSTGPVDKNERKWNIETFGVPAPTGTHHHHSHHRYHHHQSRGGATTMGGYRRGGSRGGRGRGAYQTASAGRMNAD